MKIAAEAALSGLAYNLIRVINRVGSDNIRARLA
jgi:hypothetical protein